MDWFLSVSLALGISKNMGYCHLRLQHWRFRSFTGKPANNPPSDLTPSTELADQSLRVSPTYHGNGVGIGSDVNSKTRQRLLHSCPLNASFLNIQRALAKALCAFCRQGPYIEARNRGNTNSTSATPEATSPEKTKPVNSYHSQLYLMMSG